MRVYNLYRYSVPFALSLLVTACGGGGVVAVDNSNVGDTDQSSIDSEAASLTTLGVSVTGRVADGYIRGATVCVDINMNDACDLDEPFAITGEGGAYDLAIPELHNDKPIVAAIPADAIDEDTGEAVGQPLVFIAPADRPEFLSPITTLVHQEQRANPALNSEEAEQVVKSMLGRDESNVSLVTDYVAQSDGNENTEGTADRFEYLHDTARVVASMMKDIENQVKDAAVSKGVDVVGDKDTRRAIQDIVRNEVRELLPQIARQVAEIVDNAESATTAGSDAQVSAFDPQVMALSLRPEIEAESLTGRIEANINRIDVVDSDLRSLLSDGVYWMEFDCHYDVQDEDRSIVQSENADIRKFPMPECDALYGRVQLSDDGSNLASESYVLNVSSGTWEPEDLEEENRYANYSLVGGEWVVVSSDGPDGQVEFLTSNSAVVTNDEGTMHLKSVTQELGGSPVIHHLLEDSADAVWFDLIRNEDMFPSESKAHRISVRQSYHPYILYNFPSHDVDANYCADYNQNCNVLEIVTDGVASTAVSLNQLRESIIQGVSLRSYSRFEGRALIRLHGVAQADGQLPSQGRVEWILNTGNQSVDIVSAVDIDPVDIASASLDFPDIDSADGSTDTGEAEVNQRGTLLDGRWKLIEVDSVEMIEIHLPIMFRNETDDESDEAMLLIEHDGFVRAGARLPDTRIDRVFTYNESAFETLRSIVEIGMSEGQ
jgi:hypothetical protein